MSNKKRISRKRRELSKSQSYKSMRAVIAFGLLLIRHRIQQKAMQAAQANRIKKDYPIGGFISEGGKELIIGRKHEENLYR